MASRTLTPPAVAAWVRCCRRNATVDNDVINYVGVTTTCTPTVNNARDASLDVSSLAVTVPSWSFHGRVDFVVDEGGVQPPNADQNLALSDPREKTFTPFRRSFLTSFGFVVPHR